MFTCAFCSQQGKASTGTCEFVFAQTVCCVGVMRQGGNQIPSSDARLHTCTHSVAEVGGGVAASHHVGSSDYLMGPFDTGCDLKAQSQIRGNVCVEEDIISSESFKISLVFVYPSHLKK